MNAVGEVLTENHESTVAKTSRFSISCTPNEALAFEQTCPSSLLIFFGTFGADVVISIAQGRLGSVHEATALSREETRQCVEQAYRGSTSRCSTSSHYPTKTTKCSHRQRHTGRIIPRLGRAEFGAVHLRMPPEMEPKLWCVFREGARDACVA